MGRGVDIASHANVAAMLFPVRCRHENVDFLTYHLVLIVSKDPLRCGIEGTNDAVLVGGNVAFHRTVQEGG